MKEDMTMNKRQYISPEVNVVVMNTTTMLAASGTDIKGNASADVEVLSRRGGSFWDDEDDEE